MSYPLLKVTYCWVVYFCLHFCQCLPDVSWDSFVRCTYVYYYYIFLLKWLFYHYKTSFLVSSTFFLLKSIFSDISVDTLITFRIVYFYSFITPLITFRIVYFYSFITPHYFLHCVFLFFHFQGVIASIIYIIYNIKKVYSQK